ncbi:hypothetical protein Efla_004511 [Eimeria flavescens]
MKRSHLRPKVSYELIGSSKPDNHDSFKECRPAHHHRRQPLWRQRSARMSTIVSKLALAVALYFIAARMLVYICTGSRSNVLKPGLQQRALAARGGEGEDSEDEALDSILSECLAMAEESGTVLTPFAPPAEDAEEAARRKASLEQYLRTDAPGIEAPQPSQQPTSQFPSSLDEPLLYSQTDSMALVTPWGESMDDATLQTLLSPDAWIERILPIVQEQAVGGPGGELKEDRPIHLSPAAELPLMSAPLQARTQSSRGPVESTAESRCESSTSGDKSQSPYSSSGEETPPEVVGPSTSPATLGSLPPPKRYDPNLHPYVRLPEVDHQLIPRDFNPEAPLAARFKAPYITMPLLTIRTLFLKPSLTGEEIGHVLRAAESLVNIWKRRKISPRALVHPVRTVERLSFDFLVLDALVSTRILLRERMRAPDWWPALVKTIQTDFTFPVERRRPRLPPRIEANLNRVKLLSNAVKVYKTGVRPDKKDIIKLKRMIFHPRTSPPPFKRETFDPWRWDDSIYPDMESTERYSDDDFDNDD